jgi:hypothetical protein
MYNKHCPAAFVLHNSPAGHAKALILGIFSPEINSKLALSD